MMKCISNALIVICLLCQISENKKYLLQQEKVYSIKESDGRKRY